MKVGQIWSVEYGGQKYGLRVTEMLKYGEGEGYITAVQTEFIKPKMAGFTHCKVWVSDSYSHPPHWTLIEDVP